MATTAQGTLASLALGTPKKAESSTIGGMSRYVVRLRRTILCSLINVDHNLVGHLQCQSEVRSTKYSP